jgi:hypothetical protein
VTPQIRDDQPIILGKSIGNRSPLAATPSEAVNQEQRLAFAAINIMQVNSVCMNDLARRRWLRPSY